MGVSSESGTNDAALVELLGAYALDACDSDEANAVDELLARSPEAVDELARLRNAAAWIGATEALAPRPALREEVLHVARARRGAAAANPAVELYAAETERTAACVERFRDLSVDEIAGVWSASVDTVRRHADGWPSADGPTLRWLGVDMTAEMVLVTRGFETWVHGDDLRRALGVPLEAPATGHVRMMADLAMQILPLSMSTTGRAHAGKTARVVLTGPGGGVWLVPLGTSTLSSSTPSSSTPDLTLTADVVDYCRLVAERLDPADLGATVEGDAELAGDLLASASAFAHL